MSSSLLFRVVCLLGLFGIYGLSAWSCSEKSGEVVLKGKAPERVSKLFLSQNTGIFRNVAVAEVDSFGNYELRYAVKQPEIFMLNDELGKNSVSLFLSPGDEQRVVYEGDSVVFSGDSQLNNQLLRELIIFRKGLGGRYPTDLQNAVGYKEAAEKTAIASLAYIEQANYKDKAFAEIMKVTVAKEKYSTLLSYPSIYQMIFGKQAPLESNYYHFLAEVDLSSPYWVNVSGVCAFLQDLFQTMETYGYLQSGWEDYLLKRGEQIGSPLLREKYYLYVLSSINSCPTEVKALIAGISSQVITDEGKEELKKMARLNEQKQAELEHLQAGKPAFDFVGKDVDGKEHCLSELKGRIVVVDVWSTGCKPCIAELPFLKEIEKRFAGQEVAFVSYSLDTDAKVWKNFLNVRNMSGMQWVDTLGFKSALVNHYALKGIPRFMVFGRQGEIINAFAPRPSDPRLAQLIEVSLSSGR